jgi:hypothetical protein
VLLLLSLIALLTEGHDCPNVRNPPITGVTSRLNLVGSLEVHKPVVFPSEGALIRDLKAHCQLIPAVSDGFSPDYFMTQVLQIRFLFGGW